jgi:hypothetical protein
LDFAWHDLITRPARTALTVAGLTMLIPAVFESFRLARAIRDLVGSAIKSPGPEMREIPLGRRP